MIQLPFRPLAGLVCTLMTLSCATVPGSSLFDKIHAQSTPMGPVVSEGCRIPCLFGVTPGNTRWNDASQHLASISPQIPPAYHGAGFRAGEQLYSLGLLGSSAPHQSQLHVRVVDGIVVELYLDPIDLVDLAGVGSATVVPDRVWLKTYKTGKGGELPFNIYGQWAGKQSFVALSSFESKLDGDEVEGCFRPGPSVSAIVSWSPTEASASMLRIKSTILDRAQEISDEQATEIKEVFLKITNNQAGRYCIRTSRAIWPAP